MNSVWWEKVCLETPPDRNVKKIRFDPILDAHTLLDSALGCSLAKEERGTHDIEYRKYTK